MDDETLLMITQTLTALETANDKQKWQLIKMLELTNEMCGVLVQLNQRVYATKKMDQARQIIKVDK